MAEGKHSATQTYHYYGTAIVSLPSQIAYGGWQNICHDCHGTKI